MQRERDNAKVVVENIIDAELGYLFTNDNEYLLSRTNIIPVIYDLFSSNKTDKAKDKT